MKASELIARLRSMMDAHGDLPVQLLGNLGDGIHGCQVHPLLTLREKGVDVIGYCIYEDPIAVPA